MSAPLPIFYRVEGLPFGTLLCFRTEVVDGRVLLSLIPDSPAQHILDVTAIFLDDPKLIAVDAEGEPLGTPEPVSSEAVEAIRGTEA